MMEDTYELYREWTQDEIERCEPIDSPYSRLNPNWPFDRLPICLTAPPDGRISDNLFIKKAGKEDDQ